jgi:hypothetical protein
MSPNVVYLLTCQKCQLQYVGETMQQLNERFGGHRSGFNHPEKFGSCHILSEHFTSGLCKDAPYSVQILEKLEGNGKTINNVWDPSMTKLRKERELHWMLKLRTVYPYGLNDRVGDEFKIERNQKLIASQFPKLGRTFERGSKGSHNNNTPKLTANDFLDKVHEILHSNTSEALNYIRITLNLLTKSTLKQVADSIRDTILVDDSLYTQWYLAIVDSIQSKLYKPPHQEKTYQYH